MSVRFGTRTLWNTSKTRVEETETMRVAVGTISLMLTSMVSGCSGDGGPQTSSDCSDQIKAGGIVYTSYGYTERSARRHSVAELADCDDVGGYAAGSVLPEHPHQVTTWSFRGYPPAEVVGVRFDADSFAVFVAHSVPDAKRNRIFRELD